MIDPDTFVAADEKVFSAKSLQSLSNHRGGRRSKDGNKDEQKK